MNIILQNTNFSKAKFDAVKEEFYQGSDEFRLVQGNISDDLSNLIENCGSLAKSEELNLLATSALEHDNELSYVEFLLIDKDNDFSIHVNCDMRDDVVTVAVASDSLEKSKLKALNAVSYFDQKDASADAGLIPFRFWFSNSRGGISSRDKEISCPSLEEIRDNYPADVFERISDLSKLEDPTKGGKIVLWHGEPGTGKTYCIRALAREWANNKGASIEYILNPMNILGSDKLMTDLFLSSPDLPSYKRPFSRVTNIAYARQPKDSSRLRLIIIEDKADLFSTTANCRSNPAFSSLLNISDGLIGQGLPVIFLFTANETIEELDPAIKRPGRCLSEVYFDSFTPEAAINWLVSKGCGEPGSLKKSVTLADLYARLKKNNPSVRAKPKKGSFFS